MTSLTFSSALLESIRPDATLVAEDEQPSPATAPRWSLATRIAFRFAFVYLGLYSAPMVLWMVPYASYLVGKYFDLIGVIVPWVAHYILHLQRNVAYAITGSSDTTYNYVETFIYLLVSAIITLAWSLLDRKRPNYQKLHQGLRYLVRFYLGCTMLLYGAMKVVPDQMSGALA